MCYQKLNNEAKMYYLRNKNFYNLICGPYLHLPCSCCCNYGLHFELLFLKDERNENYAQFMDLYCFKLPNNLFQQDSYEQLPRLDNIHI